VNSVSNSIWKSKQHALAAATLDLPVPIQQSRSEHDKVHIRRGDVKTAFAKDSPKLNTIPYNVSLEIAIGLFYSLTIQ
jgi:hypothetical protein